MRKDVVHIEYYSTTKKLAICNNMDRTQEHYVKSDRGSQMPFDFTYNIQNEQNETETNSQRTDDSQRGGRW